MRKITAIAVVTAIPLALSACLGVDTVRSDESRLPEIRISTQPIIVTLRANESRYTNIEVTRYVYQGSVALSLDSVPSGFEVRIEPAAVSASNRASSIYTKAPANVQSGQYHFPIRARGTGVRPATTTLVVVVE